MKLSALVTGCCGILFATSSAAAQQRVYFSPAYPTTSTRSPFQTPDPSELAKTLTGTPLPSARTSIDGAVAPDSTRRVVRTCPMPILVPDTTHLERMPLAPIDTVRRYAMPVARPACGNPLQP